MNSLTGPVNMNEARTIILNQLNESRMKWDEYIDTNEIEEAVDRVLAKLYMEGYVIVPVEDTIASKRSSEEG